MNKLKRFWSNLRTSFWFMPSLIVAASIVLAVALIEVDSTVLKGVASCILTFSGKEKWGQAGLR